MAEASPFVLVPGLNCSARIFAEQIPALWRLGSVTISDHTRGDSIAAIARSILTVAPPRFTLVGFSMGGYIGFEMLRQAPQRVAGLALLDTSARPDSPAQTAFRNQRIEMAQSGRFDEVIERQFAALVHRSRRDDKSLYAIHRAMAQELGADIFVRHQRAIIQRADSRPDLAGVRCPALVLVGDSDQIAPPDAAEEMAAGMEAARHVVVPDCGHLSLIERPEIVSQALVEWARANALGGS